MYADREVVRVERGPGVTYLGGAYVHELGVVLHNAAPLARRAG